MSKKIEFMVLTSIAAAFLSDQSVFATEVSYELRAGATYSDNVTRVSADEVDQMIGTAGISLNLDRESRRSVGSLSVDADYQYFFDDAYGNEWLSEVRGDLTLKPVPNLFHWVADGRFGQARSNPFAASTPDNREDVGNFSTGPDLFLRLGARTRLELGSRYSTTLYQRSDADTDRFSGNFSLIRALSAIRSISFNGSAERVNFDGGLGLDNFERYSAYFGFASEISRGTLSAQIGVNEIHAAGDSFQGTLADLSWTRKLTAVSSISLSLNQSFSDAGDYFSRLESLFSPTRRESSIIPVRDPFETQSLSATYDYSKGRLSFSAGVSVSDDDYQSASSFDSRRNGASLTGSIRLSSGWSSRFSFNFEDRDFQTADRTDEYLRGSAALSRDLARGFSLSFEYRLEHRQSTETSQDYTENLYTLLLRYSPGR